MRNKVCQSQWKKTKIKTIISLIAQSRIHLIVVHNVNFSANFSLLLALKVYF